MLSLKQALQDHELIVLRVIGEWWELDLTGADKAVSIEALSETLPQLDLAQELLYLPPEEAAAMRALIAAGGRLPVAVFQRRYGDVRMMGPAALEREEPWFDPESPAEALWYRGFVYKGFDETEDGLVEFFFIPAELMAQLPPESIEPERPEEAGPAPTSPPAVSPPEQFAQATTAAVDDVTTVLAMAQIKRLQAGKLEQLRPYLLDADPQRFALLVTLAVEMGLLRETGEGYRPARAAVEWLQHSREAQLKALIEAWSNSAWNELRHVPALVCEGKGWSNDPMAARTALFDALTLSDAWQRSEDLVRYVQAHDPDFQRPNGNYDTWYIRDAATGEYITGYENWVLVEGRLLRYLIEKPLVWLGLAEVGDGRFRLTPRALAWLNHEPAQERDVPVPIVVQSDGTLLVPFNTDRYQRFQAARIADPLPVERGRPFGYRITPRSLQRAKEQRIAPDRVLEFLAKTSGRPLPAGPKRAIERWAEQGTEGQVEQAIILRVRDAKILEKLRNHPKARPYIGERLGELTAVVQADHWQALCEVAAQLGLLLDTPIT